MIYKGIFWLIEGELYTKKLECDKSGNVIGDGSGLNSKSGDNFNHSPDLGGTAEKRNTWERVQLLSSGQSGNKGWQGCDIS